MLLSNIFSPNFEISIFISTKIKATEKEKKKAISAAGKREGKRRNESRRPASEPSGGGRCDAGGGGVTGSAVTPDAGSRPEPSNAQRPPRRRRRRRRRRAACASRNKHELPNIPRPRSAPFPPLPIPPSILPSLHPPPETCRRPLPLQEPRDTGGESEPPLRRAPTVRDREGGFGSLWLRVESGCLGPVLAPAPLAGRIPRCVPR
jgi:hypothetical protein